MAVSFTDFWQPEKYFVYPLDKSYPYAIICNRWANKNVLTKIASIAQW